MYFNNLSLPRIIWDDQGVRKIQRLFKGVINKAGIKYKQMHFLNWSLKCYVPTYNGRIKYLSCVEKFFFKRRKLLPFIGANILDVFFYRQKLNGFQTENNFSCKDLQELRCLQNSLENSNIYLALISISFRRKRKVLLLQILLLEFERFPLYTRALLQQIIAFYDFLLRLPSRVSNI